VFGIAIWTIRIDDIVMFGMIGIRGVRGAGAVGGRRHGATTTRWAPVACAAGSASGPSRRGGVSYPSDRSVVGDRPPATALQVHASTLRKVLGDPGNAGSR